MTREDDADATDANATDADATDADAIETDADDAGATPADSGSEAPLLTLPPTLRDALADPIGPIETDAGALLGTVEGPLIAVGDVVTYHLVQAGRTPDVAVVDGRTKRRAVDAEIREVVTDGASETVTNPPATITADLVRVLVDAIEADAPTTILVEGEEDLATLPAVVAAPDGASVVYGQPDEGMVHVSVTADLRAEVRALLGEFEGDHERLWTLLP